MTSLIYTSAGSLVQITQKNEFFSLHFLTNLSFQIFPGFPPRTVQGQGTQKKKVSPAPSFTLHSTKRKIMNVVNVTSINVLDNPCAFGNPFQFEITFECLQELKDDLGKMIGGLILGAFIVWLVFYVIPWKTIFGFIFLIIQEITS